MANKKTVAKPEETTKSAETKETKTPLMPTEIDPGQYVTVRNGFQGKLVYISPKTKEKTVWESFGDEQEMELRELKNAKSAAKKFFINNYFMFDEQWIIDYLGVGQYYKHAIRIEDFDNLFKKTPSEVKKIVKEMSPGQKRSVRYRASQLIHDGEFDSLKVINALEEVLGVELIEK